MKQSGELVYVVADYAYVYQSEAPNARHKGTLQNGSPLVYLGPSEVRKDEAWCLTSFGVGLVKVNSIKDKKA